MKNRYYVVMSVVWQYGVIPPYWKRGLVVPVWKGKDDQQYCNNYRDIILLSEAAKVFAKMLLMGIRFHLLDI